MLVFSCCLRHTLQPGPHVGPALRPGSGLRQRVPLSRSPSLHHLRGRWWSVLVRRLSGYYGTVRLLIVVHAGCAAGSLLRPARHTTCAGHDGISRFPCEEFPSMLRVSDCAESNSGSPCAPLTIWPSASDNSVGIPKNLISHLDGWPACAPVNASVEALRPLPHDSASGWLAGPSPYDSCIRYSLPVSRHTVCPANRVAGWVDANPR
jgi:hypothetical protein